MTRINVVPVHELANVHLIAEHYEIPDIFKLVRRHLRAGRSLDAVRDRIPETYRYGAGHQSFFMDKLLWLASRHQELKAEMRGRGVKVSDDRMLMELYPEIGTEWYGDYDPPYEAQLINRALIEERLAGMRAKGRKV